MAQSSIEKQKQTEIKLVYSDRETHVSCLLCMSYLMSHGGIIVEQTKTREAKGSQELENES